MYRATSVGYTPTINVPQVIVYDGLGDTQGTTLNSPTPGFIAVADTGEYLVNVSVVFQRTTHSDGYNLQVCKNNIGTPLAQLSAPIPDQVDENGVAISLSGIVHLVGGTDSLVVTFTDVTSSISTVGILECTFTITSIGSAGSTGATGPGGGPPGSTGPTGATGPAGLPAVYGSMYRATSVGYTPTINVPQVIVYDGLGDTQGTTLNSPTPGFIAVADTGEYLVNVSVVFQRTTHSDGYNLQVCKNNIGTPLAQLSAPIPDQVDENGVAISLSGIVHLVGGTDSLVVTFTDVTSSISTVGILECTFTITSIGSAGSTGATGPGGGPAGPTGPTGASGGAPVYGAIYYGAGLGGPITITPVAATPTQLKGWTFQCPTPSGVAQSLPNGELKPTVPLGAGGSEFLVGVTFETYSASADSWKLSLYKNGIEVGGGATAIWETLGSSAQNSPCFEFLINLLEGEVLSLWIVNGFGNSITIYSGQFCITAIGTSGAAGTTGPTGPSGTGSTGPTGSGGAGATGPAGAANVSSGLAANRPAATTAGGLYYCKDTPIVYVNPAGSAVWEQYTSEFLPSTVTAAQYTLVGALSLVQFADSIRAAFASNTTSKAACALTQQNIGSGGFPANLNATTPWMVTVAATAIWYIGYASPTIGAIVTNGVTDNTSVGYAASWEMTGNLTPTFRASEITVDGVQVTNYVSSQGLPIGTGRLHSRIVNDGVLLHFQASGDGMNWSDVVSENTPAGLTWYGFNMGSTNNNTGAWSIALVSSNNLGIPTRYNVSAMSGGFGNPTVTIGAHTIQPGDQISLQGALPLVSMPNTAAGTGLGGIANTGATIVTAVSATTITFIGQAPGGTGTYAGGGVITLLSR